MGHDEANLNKIKLENNQWTKLYRKVSTIIQDLQNNTKGKTAHSTVFKIIQQNKKSFVEKMKLFGKYLFKLMGTI